MSDAVEICPICGRPEAEHDEGITPEGEAYTECPPVQPTPQPEAWGES